MSRRPLFRPSWPRPIWSWLSWRGLRLGSGLVLMAFATTHLLNHAFGLVSFEAMDPAREWLGFWHRPLVWPILLAAFVLHILAALWSLYERRGLRLALWQYVQIASGVLIPLFLALHYMGSRGVFQTLGIPIGYEFELFALWPDHAWRQSILLVLVWLHGCMGVHYWLRLHGWYRRIAGPLLALAVLVPTLSLLGFVSAGRELRAKAAVEPAWLEGVARAERWPSEPAALDFVYQGERLIIGVFLALVVLTLLARAARAFWRERRNSFAVTYAGGRRVRAQRGTSLLEVSRLHGIAHASVCGGRGRCSTCRVRITGGGEVLPPPSPAEARVLQRLGAAPEVRLACQTRPMGDVELALLMPAETTSRESLRPMNPGHGVERETAVLFADLRSFTRLSEGRLPFDVVHLLNRYFKTMGAAIDDAGGHVDKFIGDGIMALFGLDTDPETAARQALRAARSMGAALDGLNHEFRAELPQPLRMVIGLHLGTTIVGELGYGRSITLTAIGDAVNVASRLEGVAKEQNVPFVVSTALLERAGITADALPHQEVALRGRGESLHVVLFAATDELPTVPATTSPRSLMARLLSRSPPVAA